MEVRIDTYSSKLDYYDEWDNCYTVVHTFYNKDIVDIYPNVVSFKFYYQACEYADKFCNYLIYIGYIEKYIMNDCIKAALRK